MEVLLFLIERHFLMHFYVPFHFLKVDFDFAPVPKEAFCKAKVQRGIPKGKKRGTSLFLESDGIFLCTLYAISFF